MPPCLQLHNWAKVFLNLLLNYPIKVENIQEDSLDSIPSPSLSVKIQIMSGKVCLRCKGKTLLGLSTNF